MMCDCVLVKYTLSHSLSSGGAKKTKKLSILAGCRTSEESTAKPLNLLKNFLPFMVLFSDNSNQHYHLFLL